MKNKFLFLVLSALLLMGCSGSETYQGEWKAMAPNGNKYEFTFTPKSFTIHSSKGETQTYEYTQNAIKINNGVRTYGLKLSDGRSIKIVFPRAKDKTKGVILTDEDIVLYTISKADYISYDDLIKLD